MSQKRYPRLGLATAFVFSLFITCTEHTFAQPPDVGPELQTQTREGYTTRLKRAFWGIPQLQDQPDYAGKGLTVEFEAEDVKLPHSGNMSASFSDIQVSGPNGEPIRFQRPNWENKLLISDVNPHWPEITLDFELQINSDDWQMVLGRAFKKLDFTDIPLPDQTNQSLPVGQTLKAEWGTKVTLRDITLRSNAQTGNTPVYVLTLDFEADPKLGDLTYSVSNSQTSLGNDGKAIANTWAQRNLIVADDVPATRRRQRWEFTIGKAQINPQDLLKKVGFRLELMEWSPSRRRMANFKRFRFRLPLKDIPDFTPNYQPRVIAQTKNDSVQIQLEDWMIPNNAHILRLWTRPADTKSVNGWIIKSLTLDQNSYSIQQNKPPFYASGRSGWKANGRAAWPNENSYSFWSSVTMRDKNQLKEGEKSENHQFKMELHQIRYTTSRFAFSNLPVPTGDGITSINRLKRDASGGTWTILAIANYHDSKLPSGWPAPANFPPPFKNNYLGEYLPSSDGIALACRWKPAGGINTIQAAHRFTAKAQSGFPMLDEPATFLLPSVPDKWPFDDGLKVTVMEPSAPKAQHDFTLFLLPPGPTVSKFDVNFSVREAITTGMQQTVVLPFETAN